MKAVVAFARDADFPHVEVKCQIVFSHTLAGVAFFIFIMAELRVNWVNN